MHLSKGRKDIDTDETSKTCNEALQDVTSELRHSTFASEIVKVNAMNSRLSIPLADCFRDNSLAMEYRNMTQNFVRIKLSILWLQREVKVVHR